MASNHRSLPEVLAQPILWQAIRRKHRYALLAAGVLCGETDAAVGSRELRQRQQVFAGQTPELSGMLISRCRGS